MLLKSHNQSPNLLHTQNYRSILHLEQIVVQNLPLPNKQEALDD